METKNQNKKKKLIELDNESIKILSIMAIKNNSNFKNFVEAILTNIALGNTPGPTPEPQKKINQKKRGI